MLNAPTPFPYVGSYALIEHEGENTLARIVMRRIVSEAPGVPCHEEFVVGLPLVDGASGNLRVPADRLIDATPLTGEETREFHELDRHLATRSLAQLRRLKAQKARRDALRQRVIYAPIMARLLREASIRWAA